MMRRARDSNGEKEREGERENKGGEIEREGERREAQARAKAISFTLEALK